MNTKKRVALLGAYDLILSVGAIILGIFMIGSTQGIFTEYPKEWLSKLPFDSWVIPGILAIGVFGLGNMFSSIVSFIKSGIKPWFVSVIMGCILFISLIVQIVILGEWYLATLEFFILSIIQICLSIYAYSGYRKKHASSFILSNKI